MVLQLINNNVRVIKDNTLNVEGSGVISRNYLSNPENTIQ